MNATVKIEPTKLRELFDAADTGLHFIAISQFNITLHATAKEAYRTVKNKPHLCFSLRTWTSGYAPCNETFCPEI